MSLDVRLELAQTALGETVLRFRVHTVREDVRLGMIERAPHGEHALDENRVHILGHGTGTEEESERLVGSLGAVAKDAMDDAFAPCFLQA